jgi:D-alanyl-lipoteichoic acid acyltransferase DltB (MBOAT superfamily)
MRDYIFYPLSLSKAFAKIGRASRKVFGNYAGKKIPSMLGMLITFTVVGVWHGSSWKFVAYGLYNAVFIMLDIFLYPLLSDFLNKHRFSTETFSWRLYQMVITFLIVSVGRFFSRASSFKAALRMIIRSFTTFKFSDFISLNFNNFGLDTPQMSILVISLIILFVIEILQEKGINIRLSIAKQDFIFRWSLFLTLIFAIIIFGIYGIGYNSNDFIYMGF